MLATLSMPLIKRTALTIVSAIFSTAGIAAENGAIPVEPAGWQITHEDVGNLRWGMTRAEIVALFPDAEETGAELFIQYLFFDSCVFRMQFRFGQSDELVALEKVYSSGDHDRCLHLSRRQLNRFVPDVAGGTDWRINGTRILIDEDFPFTFSYSESGPQ